MKKLILLIFLMTSMFCKAQNFAPIGTEWYYTEGFVFDSDIDYLKIESVKDTAFHGKVCKLLVKTGNLYCSNRPAQEIVYSEDSIVYFWDNDFNEFQTLFDFNAKKDSSWIVKIKNHDNDTDTITIVVDSVSYQSILDKTFKTLHVTYYPKYGGIDISFYYSSKIIYPIGDFTYLFNLYPDWYLVCDNNYSDGLRCYIDPLIGFFSTGIADSCTYTSKWTNIENPEKIQSQIEVFPNPSSGYFQINCKDQEMASYDLFDSFGRMIKANDFTGSVNIDISEFPDGLYVIFIRTGKNSIEKRKIVKMNTH